MQGFVLTPTLSSIFFSMMLKQAAYGLEDEEVECIEYYKDCNLFNLHQIQAHTKIKQKLSCYFLFVDDIALVTHT